VNIKIRRMLSMPPKPNGGFLMFTRQNIIRLLLVGLLLALMAVPVVGVALGSDVAANDGPDSTLLYHISPMDGGGIAIACQSGDPGGGQGGGC
jgi:hypothetical protein